MDPILPEFLRDFALALGPLTVGFVVAAFVHEGGHALFGLLVGIRPRVVNVGVGRPWLRMRVSGTWLVVRIGLLAAGWNSHEPSDRRWALAVLVAGGPLANLIALAALYGTTLIAPETYPWLEPFGFAQAGAIVLTLFPTTQKMNGRKLATDGLHLYRLCVLGRAPNVAATYAGLLRPVQVAGADPHPLTRNTRAILFEAARPDRWSESWAFRDSIARLGAILGARDLTREERAFVLCDLVILQLLVGRAETTWDVLQAYVAEISDLCSTPRAEVVLGAALMAEGRIEGGKPILLASVSKLKERKEMLTAAAVLCCASIGAASRLSRDSADIEWFDIATTIATRLGGGRGIARAVTRMRRETFQDDTAPEAHWSRLGRWLRGEDLP